MNSSNRLGGIIICTWFAGYDWVLLDPVYLQNKRNPVEIQKWRQFFMKLGLTDFISVRQVNVKISADNIVSWIQCLSVFLIK